MVRLLRRVVLASLLFGAAAFVVRRRRGLPPPRPCHDPSVHTSSTAWPPITTDDDAPAASIARSSADRRSDLRPFVEVANDGAASTTTEAARWVPPVDGQCPDGYPVKANASSMIFHVPGGRFYSRTVPERCYAKADDAAADGYRAAKA